MLPCANCGVSFLAQHALKTSRGVVVSWNTKSYQACIRSFLKGKEYRAGNLRTDGKRLTSYKFAIISEKNKDGVLLYNQWQYASATTAIIVALVAHYAHETNTKLRIAPEKLPQVEKVKLNKRQAQARDLITSRLTKLTV